jgi:DNA-binding transcriptional ArsR family regulator
MSVPTPGQLASAGSLFPENESKICAVFKKDRLKFAQVNTCPYIRKQILAYMTMEIRRDVFQGIADPTRRDILSMLTQQPQNVNALAERFSMTRQAVSLHVKILHECGLISINQQGRERICQLQAQKLSEVDRWLAPFRKTWEERFSRLDTLLTKGTKTKKHGK